MSSKRVLGRFAFSVVLRTLALAASISALVGVLFFRPSSVAAPGLTLVLIVGQLVSLVRYVARTNRELVRFFEALRGDDFTQNFTRPGEGSEFDALGGALDEVVTSFRKSRAVQEQEIRFSRALLDQAPVPLLTVEGEQVELLNNASRKLLLGRPVRRLADLEPLGRELQEAIVHTPLGRRRVVSLHLDGARSQAALSVSEIVMEGRRRRLVSLQSIDGELEHQEVEAWQKLVRVLTHELGNSITPVASLTKTALSLAEEGSSPKAHKEIAEALRAIERRAAGLVAFVRTYRELKSSPKPHPERYAIAPQLEALSRLMAAEWGEEVQLEVSVDPARLEAFADPGLMDQVLVNLLRNAGDAAREGTEAPRVRVEAFLDRRGRVSYEVSDNGPGIPPDRADRIFIPFFSTKDGGSGVGLPLSRQIMVAHGGSVRLVHRDGPGTTFRLTL